MLFKINKFVFSLFSCFTMLSNAQTYTIKGTFTQLKNTEITLLGYNGFKSETLNKTQCDSVGKFHINYPSSYKGAALLQIKDNTSMIILLNKENIEIQWDTISNYNSLKISNSIENETFTIGTNLYQEIQQKFSGLKYLSTIYQKNSKQHLWLNQEIETLDQIFIDYVNTIPQNHYAKYYLTIRKLISDIQLSIQKKDGNLFRITNQFNQFNFNDDKLLHSGLMQELIDSYFTLLEKQEGENLKINLINNSIDSLVKNLSSNNDTQQIIAQHLFSFLEKYSLFKSSEHLALSMLNQQNCQLSEKSIDLFEQYRKLAINKIAPDIVLDNGITLSSLPSNYKLVLFGASWCPNCQQELPSIFGKASEYKTKYNLDIIYISLDTDKIAFYQSYKNTSFHTFCDGKGWESQVVKDYHIFATPTMLLLDKNLKIVMKINNAQHLKEWLALNIDKS